MKIDISAFFTNSEHSKKDEVNSPVRKKQKIHENLEQNSCPKKVRNVIKSKSFFKSQISDKGGGRRESKKSCERFIKNQVKQ